MTDEELHDQIERYLLGNMPAEERIRLETGMATDKRLAEQVALQQLALAGIQRLEAREMRKKFEAWDKEVEDIPNSGNRVHYSWLWATFVLTGLLVFGIFMHFNQLQKKHREHLRELETIATRDSLIALLQKDFRELSFSLDSLSHLKNSEKDSSLNAKMIQLRNQLEQRDRILRELERQRNTGKPQMAMRLAPPPVRQRGAGDNTGTDIAKARKAYNEGKFTQAVRLFQLIPAAAPEQAQVTQLLPYALFYAGMYDEAVPAFVKLWESDPANEAMNAQVFLLLCYLANGDKSEARLMRMIIIQQEDHKYLNIAVAVRDSI
jgi:tetratricopeptide (TPR) repeat protein